MSHMSELAIEQHNEFEDLIYKLIEEKRNAFPALSDEQIRPHIICRLRNDGAYFQATVKRTSLTIEELQGYINT